MRVSDRVVCVSRCTVGEVDKKPQFDEREEATNDHQQICKKDEEPDCGLRAAVGKRRFNPGVESAGRRWCHKESSFRVILQRRNGYCWAGRVSMPTGAGLH